MATKRNIVLEIKNLSHRFGEKSVLFNVKLQVKTGEIVGLVGPSGCGKSTLLRAIVGTHPPTEGSVFIYDEAGKNPIEVREPTGDCGIVYQEYSLYPFATALENVTSGLLFEESSLPDRFLRWVPFYREKRGKEMSWHNLEKIQLEEAAEFLKKLKLADAMHHYPHELSGGMRQRVAIAQALIMKPRIVLLDEPFGALDEATRQELQTMLLELYAENIQAKREGKAPPYTIIFVTHAISEAIRVSDRIIGLSKFWDWQNETNPHAKEAATIVYDEVAPVYKPGDKFSEAEVAEQCDGIIHAVLDKDYCQDQNEFRKFWQQLTNGKGQGVLENEKD